MDWQFLSPRCIRHKHGYEIKLIKGTWKNPIEIQENYVDSLKSSKCIQLLCEGLYFAEKNSEDTKSSVGI